MSGLDGFNDTKENKIVNENSESKIGKMDDLKDFNKQNEVDAKQMTDLKDEAQGEKTSEAKSDIHENLNDVKNEAISENMAAPKIVYNLSEDVPVAVVTGDPFNTGKNLDWKQGDNPYHALGNCGLVSVTNLLRMAGLDVTEDDVTKFALDNKLCNNPLIGKDGDRGGTTPQNRLDVLKAFGVNAESFNNLPLNDVADAVEQGKGVLMSVNAGYLWDEPAYVKDPMGNTRTNHCITVTSVARDPSTGEVSGFYICDSGRGEASDSARFVSADLLNACYTNMPGGTVQITNNPIR